MTHAIHLIISNRVAGEALARSQEALGHNVARLVANEAADAVLVDDKLSLRALTKGAVSGQDVAYCFITRDGRVLASSLPGTTPYALIDARRSSDTSSFVIASGRARYLDVAEPILNGSAGTVRVGVDLSVVEATRHRVSLLLGILAVGVIAVGVIAAFVVGRSIAHPIRVLLDAADRFDPAGEAHAVESSSSDEVGELAERFNRMMVRLKVAYEEQVRAREKQGQTERMAALGTLVAGVAHEVNNPVAGMKTCLRRLQREDLVAESKRGEYLELIEEGLERIEDVMRHLLDFARPRPLRLEAIMVSDLIREGSSLLRPILARRRIELREDASDARVIADCKQTAQALLNLLLNAAYVTPEAGEIRIRVRQRPGLCGIAVEDDGPGVPPDIRDRILDPFFTTKPEGEGTGLGLSVIKSIVDAHGGELTLEFPAAGTVATMWLRAASGAAAQQATTPA